MAFLPGSADGVMNNTTAVTLVAAPANNTTQRLIKCLTVYNRDTAAVTLNVFFIDGASTRYMFSPVLQVGDSWVFGDKGETLVLDNTNKSIQANLAGAVTTTQPDWTSHYADNS